MESFANYVQLAFLYQIISNGSSSVQYTAEEAVIYDSRNSGEN